MKVNNTLVTEVNGRYRYTFTPKTPNELVSLSHLGGIGDTEIKGIQIEKGIIDTAFVEPTITPDNITGIFEDLRAINVEMTDPKSNLWSSIKINNEAYLREFGSDMIGSMVGQTADSIYNRVENKISGEYASFELRMAGLQAQVTGDVSQSVSTQLQGLFNNRITDIEGNVSDSLQMVDAFKNQIAAIDGRLSESIQTVSGFQQQVYGLDGAFSSVKQRVEGLQTKVVDAEGNVASLTILAEGLQAKVTGVNGLESKYTQLAGVIETKVTKTDVEGIIRNSGNDIWLVIKDKVPKMTGTDIVAELSLSPSGVRIAGKNITLDGNTFISDAVIKSAHIQNVSADKLTAGTINGAILNVINVNASNIVGNTAAFVQAAFNSMGSNLSIDAYGITVNGIDGKKTIFRQGGLSVFKNGVEVGAIQGNHLQSDSTATGLSFNTEPGKHMAWGRKSTASSASYSIYMWIPNNRNVVETLVPFEPHTLETRNAYIENIRPIGNGIVTIVSKDNAKVADFGNTSIDFYKKLDMHNFTIVNNSDERLKNILGTTKQKAIPLLDKMELVDYTWRDPNSPAGTHMGLIAQNTPYITEVNEKGVWGINLQKHVMFNTLTNKELLLKIRQLENEVEKLKGVA